MIEFRLFGPLSLRRPDGTEIRSVLAQPKRTALLAYLALPESGTFVRRDRLLGVFWPESDTDRARGALRRSLHFLRQSLGEGVIVSRGDEEVGIAPGTLRCDAAELARLVAAGSHAEALELYRGDLLEGFFISDAPEFDGWLETERRRLREMAIRAAWSLAAAAEEDGDLDAARRFAGRAMVLEGGAEPATRRWMSLLARSGDPAGALSAYEELSGRLLRDHQVEPSPDTRALAEEIRRSSEAEEAAAPVRATAPAVPVAGLPAAGASTPIASGTAGIPSWLRSSGRRLAAAAVLAVVLAGVGVTAWSSSAPEPPIPSGAASADLVAVFPFAYYGTGESDYLREGIARLLSTNLNGAGSLRSVDPRVVLGALDREQRGALPSHRALEIGAGLGAGLVLQGHIVEAGDRLRITAALHETRRPGAQPAEATVEGTREEVFSLLDGLTAELLAGSRPGSTTRLSRIAALTTHSLPALKAYLEGETHLHDGRYRQAIEAYRRAVGTDSTFALAYYRLSSAAHWINDVEAGRWAAGRAFEHSDRLTPRDRLLVRAWIPYRDGDPVEAERLFRSFVAEYPDDVDSWFQLGEIGFHWGPSLGRPAGAARGAFARVLTYEPANAGALIHVARLSALRRDTADVNRLVAQIEALEPGGDQSLEMEALRVFLAGDRPGIDRLRERLRGASGAQLGRMVSAVATFAADLVGAAELAELLTEPGRSAHDQLHGRLLRAQLLAAAGRPGAAERELRTAEGLPRRIDLPSPAEFRAVVAAHPLFGLPAERLNSAREGVAGLPPAQTLSDWDATAPHPRSIYGPHRSYLLGLLSVRLGDPVAALDQAIQLERTRGTPVDSGFALDRSRTLRAQVALTGGQPEDALRALGAPRLLPDNRLPHLGSYVAADERFLRAEILRALGRLEEALGWYATFPDPAGYDLLYLAPAHLRSAQILDALGREEEALVHRDRFLELWEGCEPELLPLVEEARRIARSGPG